MTEELLLHIDVDKRTTRGRFCPRCGGKIIPSDRAVYQATNPDDSFPIWQCERCGYEEMTATKAPAKNAVTPATTSSQLTPAKPTPKPTRTDSRGRALPPDVSALMLQMELQNPKEV
jgi:ribosomal protein S27AE